VIVQNAHYWLHWKRIKEFYIAAVIKVGIPREVWWIIMKCIYSWEQLEDIIRYGPFIFAKEEHTEMYLLYSLNAKYKSKCPFLLAFCSFLLPFNAFNSDARLHFF
jgi:hypothetical protein